MKTASSENGKLFEDLLSLREDVFRICLGFSRDPTDAEDLSQEVYLKAYRGIADVHTPYAAREWLFRITRNTCLDHAKREMTARRHVQSLDPAEASDERTPDVAADTTERLSALKRTIAGLPKKQREILVLREYGRLSYQELGRTLGIREGTVMSCLNRARRAVIDHLKEAGYA